MAQYPYDSIDIRQIFFLYNILVRLFFIETGYFLSDCQTHAHHPHYTQEKDACPTLDICRNLLTILFFEKFMSPAGLLLKESHSALTTKPESGYKKTGVMSLTVHHIA